MDFHVFTSKMTINQKKHWYLYNTKPILNTKALFSDGTSKYRNPVEPEEYEEVKVRLRTAKDNVDAVYLLYNDVKQLAKRIDGDRLFDYYEGVIPPSKDATSYCFEIHAGEAVCFYNKNGVTKEHEPAFDYKIVPGFVTPNWAKGAVFYQIYVDRFCNGDTSNDVVDNEYIYIGEPVHQVKEWRQYPAEMDVRHFYGGDLQGVKDKLDYLKGLGVDVIYLNPVFVSPSNHKYDIQDYDYIDPHFGRILVDEGEPLRDDQRENKDATKYISRVTNKTNLEASNQLMIELVEAIHARGMRVILDGVFNHCGSFNKWIDKERLYENEEGYAKGAYVSAESPYRDFFHFHNEGEWPYNGSYDGWWGHDTLPKLNYEGSDTLYQYILQVGRKWVSAPYNVDGWRLDVAADLGNSEEFNHRFWGDFRRAVKQANKDAIVLAEHYGNPTAWLQGDQWDTVMNYDAFMEPLTWFLTGVEKHSDKYREDLFGNADAFVGAMKHHMASFHQQSLQVAMNELSNHDHSRFLTRTNHKVGRTANMGPKAAEEGINKGIFREAVVMQMTWIGAPTIYYGDEAGLCGWTDPDNRRTYPWGEEDQELIQFHKDIIGIHKTGTALKNGSLQYLYTGYQALAYGRYDDDDKFVIAVNNAYHSQHIEFEVWTIGLGRSATLVRIMKTTEQGYTTEGVVVDVVNGKLSLDLEPYSAVVLREL